MLNGRDWEMNNLKKTLFKKKKRFIEYLAAGDPSLDKLQSIIHALEVVGCDVSETGVEF